MDLESKIKEIEDSIDEYIIDVYDSNFLHVPIKLSYFELKGYKELVIELNQIRYTCKTYEEKELFVEKYKKIYSSSRKMYKRLLRNLSHGTVKILYSNTLNGNKEYLYRTLKNFKNFDFDKSLEENLTIFMIAKLKQSIKESNQELFKLEYYPMEYINTFSTYVGSKVLKHRNDLIMYKDVFISSTDTHSHSTFYNENTSEDTKNTVLNILAFFNGHPSFYFTENYDFNRKLAELYEQFDLLDMLRLRKKNFFDSKKKEPFYLEFPILKQNKDYDMVCFEDSDHEMVFELYHASLKQFESLPRCVFLFRVFEYGTVKHYKPLMTPSNYRPEDALNYYATEIMTHRFIPLYYVDFGTYVNGSEQEIIRKRKAKYVNFITKLKEEAKKIKEEWSTHSFLQNKNIGDIIYGTGRNASAHGGGGRRNARYDYAKNYKHINDVNIFLELIARYIIEKLNPHLDHMVERRLSNYTKYNNYPMFTEQEKD
ncbi:hypothetical protein [Paenibacillus xylanexedens]|uniref:hypothetical protein n=1 Tax=Paenibacillus xylanexedens TaxID=528191 RepID=UPI0011A81246|nr:hypothetical protein [Paenibacillus xylanexedens]